MHRVSSKTSQVGHTELCCTETVDRAEKLSCELKGITGSGNRLSARNPYSKNTVFGPHTTLKLQSLFRVSKHPQMIYVEKLIIKN
jgi:hypothetical protein